MTNTITFIIALIGCVTGVSSLLIKFSEWLRSRPKIKCHQPKTYRNWIVKVENENSPSFLKNENNLFVHFSKSESYDFAVLPVMLINQSAAPVTIYDIVPADKNINYSKRFDYYLGSVDYGEKSNKHYTYNSLNSINLPLRIEPFDSIECCVLLYFFQIDVSKTKRLKIFFQTANRKFSYTPNDFSYYGKIPDNIED